MVYKPTYIWGALSCTLLKKNWKYHDRPQTPLAHQCSIHGQNKLRCLVWMYPHRNFQTTRCRTATQLLWDWCAVILSAWKTGTTGTFRSCSRLKPALRGRSSFGTKIWNYNVCIIRLIILQKNLCYKLCFSLPGASDNEEKKTGWWFLATPLKNMSHSQLGWLAIPNSHGTIKFMATKPPTRLSPDQWESQPDHLVGSWTARQLPDVAVRPTVKKREKSNEQKCIEIDTIMGI